MSDPEHVGVMLHIGRRDRVEFLTPQEIAKRLKLPIRSVHELCRSKQLPAFKVGKLWRVNADDFERWAQEQKEKNPSREPADTVAAPRTVEARIKRRAT